MAVKGVGGQGLCRRRRRWKLKGLSYAGRAESVEPLRYLALRFVFWPIELLDGVGNRDTMGLSM
jgi:hypothetical protein